MFWWCVADEVVTHKPSITSTRIKVELVLLSWQREPLAALYNQEGHLLHTEACSGCTLHLNLTSLHAASNQYLLTVLLYRCFEHSLPAVEDRLL